MNRRHFAALLASVATPALLSRPALADAPNVKFAISLRSVLYLPAVLAAQGGYFAKRGLNVEVNIVEGGSKTAAAVLSGDVDFANLGFQHVIALRAKNQPVIAVGTTLNDAAVVLMMSTKWLAAHNLDGKDATTVIKAMKGARIGTAGPGTTGDLILRTLLERNGMKQSDIATVAATSQAGIAALQQGSIDGTASYMPIIEMIEALGLAKPVIASWQIPGVAGQAGDAIMARTDALDKSPDVARKFMSAIGDALKLVVSDRKATLALTTAALPGFTPAVLAKAVADRTPLTPATPILAYDRVHTAVQWFHDMGLITADIPFESLATNKYLT